ncbi:alpha-L-arabinofuranosidase C-terminal domain-containing protein [Saccharicrinis sp. FJH62]|uniref:alpha-L-arabinofuranosidase C-terminal domain-containing protein n=1 Tax=Saccharicrinis sp. FJH62 TaxID=3344657 RepID=UPI0035D4BA95
MTRKLLAIFLIALSVNLVGQTKLVVKPNDPIAKIQPTMYGIFFEDINFAADGGIYAELVKNRSFEFFEPMMGWLEPNSDRHSLNLKSGKATPIKRSSDEKNQHFIKIEVNDPSGYSIINEGFRGMGIKKDDTYNLTFLAREEKGINHVIFSLVAQDGSIIGSDTVAVNGNKWENYATSIRADKTCPKAKLQITFAEKGIIDMDMISMFPEDTWKGRPKGLRKDLVQLLADMQPGFLRFPGGCIVEGRTLDRRYQWKKTVGPIEERENLVNRWNTEFAHRLTPDYYQSFGLGFFEYFQLAEDLGAQPLPILSCGMACQFNTGELVPMEELDPYVDDALDLIEFANGDPSTEWGKVRADMGHPEPFNLKYIGIGNEQWGPEYFKRYKIFDKAIKEKYPDIVVVSGSGPFPDGEYFDYGWEQLKKLHAEIVDEHYYRPPQWFLDNATRYDNYDRSGPKVFAGEYAAQSVAIASPKNKNNWDCALSEAAFITGMERNADLVIMTSYAPLFAHVDGWQWTPDLIWFDNLRSMGSANYYVQKMFSTNTGDDVVPILLDGKDVTGQDGLYATASVKNSTNEIILKLVNSTNTDKSLSFDFEGLKKFGKKVTVISLTGSSPDDMNTLDNPKEIYPEETIIKTNGKDMKLDIGAKSLVVVKIKK